MKSQTVLLRPHPSFDERVALNLFARIKGTRVPKLRFAFVDTHTQLSSEAYDIGVIQKAEDVGSITRKVALDFLELEDLARLEPLMAGIDEHMSSGALTDKPYSPFSLAWLIDKLPEALFQEGEKAVKLRRRAILEGDKLLNTVIDFFMKANPEADGSKTAFEEQFPCWTPQPQLPLNIQGFAFALHCLNPNRDVSWLNQRIQDLEDKFQGLIENYNQAVRDLEQEHRTIWDVRGLRILFIDTNDPTKKRAVWDAYDNIHMLVHLERIGNRTVARVFAQSKVDLTELFEQLFEELNKREKRSWIIAMNHKGECPVLISGLKEDEMDHKSSRLVQNPEQFVQLIQRVMTR